ncbi:MAG TPA: ComEC/Rec2 family competence protein [Verrucomicrobiae bacterium]|nr:ComEC/Rec2 family competence protein [Verrucomicrobiae bacterium]
MHAGDAEDAEAQAGSVSSASLRLQFQRRPFLPLATLLILGIVVGHRWRIELSWWVGSWCLALILVLFGKTRLFAVALTLCVLGGGLYAARYQIFSSDDLRLIINDKPALVKIRGKLVQTPNLRDFYPGTNVVEYSYSQVRVAEIELEKQWRKASGTVSTTMRGTLDPAYFEGRSVEVTGVTQRPAKAQAPGLFDYREYLYNQRIFYQLKTESTNDWRLLSFERMPLTERFLRWAQNQLRRGLPLQDEPLEMVWTMALGWKQSFSGEIADAFMKTGTMHIFAISGLHVACIAGMLLSISRVAGFSRQNCGTIVIPLIWFYTLATGWQSSAIRSALMSSVIIAGWALQRPTDLLNSTAAAAFLILIFQPEQLFQVSFQLSFAVVASIAFFLPIFEEMCQRPFAPDPFLPPELRTKWKQWLDAPLGFVTGNFVVSLASFVGALPITAYYFNTVTLISLFANLVAVPLSSLSLAATMASLLLPPLGPIFNYLSWAAMWETIEFTRWCARIPFGYFYVAKPNLWFFLFYFGVVFLLLIPQFRKLKWKFGWVLTTTFGMVWLASLLFSMRETSITALPFAGMPIYVDRAGGSDDLLVDCSNKREAGRSLKQFLRAQGAGSLGNLVLTHIDASHAGGFQLILHEFSPRTIFTGSARVRSALYRETRETLESFPEKSMIAAAGELIRDWEVLHPKTGASFSRGADNALVLRSRIQDWTILLLSDLGRLGQQALLKSGAELRADILLAGTGADESPNEDLIEAIGPRVIILGKTSRPFAPARSEKGRKLLQKSSADVFLTDEEGAVTIIIAAEKCSITTAEGSQTKTYDR